MAYTSLLQQWAQSEISTWGDDHKCDIACVLHAIYGGTSSHQGGWRDSEGSFKRGWGKGDTSIATEFQNNSYQITHSSLTESVGVYLKSFYKTTYILLHYSWEKKKKSLPLAWKTGRRKTQFGLFTAWDYPKSLHSQSGCWASGEPVCCSQGMMHSCHMWNSHIGVSRVMLMSFICGKGEI